MADTVLGALRKEIIEHRRTRQDALAGGGATDFAQYREMCGELKGLGVALDLVIDFQNRLDNTES